MKRFRLTLLMSFIVIALLGTLLFVALKALPESDFLRDSVCSSISTLTQQEVTLGAVRISVSFPSLIELSFENIAVKSKLGEELFSAERVTLIPSLASLFKHEIAIESVTLANVHLLIKREPDGTALGGCLPVGGQQKSSETIPVRETQKAEELVTRDVSPASEAHPQELAPRFPLKWSVNSLNIVNAQIDWTDSVVLPNQEVKISLKELGGTVDQQKNRSSFAFKLRGKLVGENAESGLLTIDGSAHTAADMKTLDHVEAQLHGESVKLLTIGPYLSGFGPMTRDFKIDALDSHITWAKDKPATIALTTDIISDSTEKARIKVKADLSATNDFGTIKECRGTCKTDGLSLRFLKTLLPANFPLNPEKGFIRAETSGTWTGPQDWKLQGTLDLEKAEPSGKFAKFAKEVRVLAQANLNPDNLVVDNLEIFESAKLASLKGSVHGPLSRSPQLDLKGEAVFRSNWMRELGVQLPEVLNVTGFIPVTGTVKGFVEDPVLNVNCDMSKLGISWAPYFEKPPATSGLISLKGRLPTKNGLHSKGAVPQMDIRADVSGINLRLSPKGQVFTGSHLQLETKIAPDSKGYSLRDIVLILKKGDYPVELLSARGSLMELGSETIRIDLTGAINWDNFLEAPLKVKGRLNQVGSVEKLNGTLSVELGKGSVKAGILKIILPEEQLIVQNLIKTGLQLSRDILDFDIVSGSFQFESGMLRTDDLKLRGPVASLGVIGKLRLTSQQLDAITCVQTTIPVQAAATAGRLLTKIPEVQKLIKQNEGLLKATGLDKELKRFGIQPSESNQEKEAQPEIPKTQATIIVKLRGPLSGLERKIVWESELDKLTVSRLKALVN